MTKVNKLKRNDAGYPAILKAIPDSPSEIYWVGAKPSSWLDKPKVAIVGSRKVSPYGREVTQRLAGELAQFNIAIISGLAYGVDSVAHEATLEAGGITIAVLPTELGQIYPASHASLARKITDHAGTLISEYSPGSVPNRGNFIARNRIVSGLADVLVITEAAISSGSLHTAGFALEQGRTVMVVPGNITSAGSVGTNNLIKSGALPVTDASDVLLALGLTPKTTTRRAFRGTSDQEKVLDAIRNGISSQEELATGSGLDGAAIGQVLTALEINGHIRAIGAGHWLAN